MLTIIARSVRGLEWLTAGEVSDAPLEAGGLAMSNREVTFTVPDLTPALLRLRTVDDVFAEVGRVPGVGPARGALPLAARRTADLDWTGALGRLAAIRALAARPKLDVVASVAGKHNYNRFAVENAVGESLARRLNGSYLVRTSTGRQAGDPDLVVRVFVRDTEAVVAVQVGAQPLHRRRYKQEAGAGTLHPPVAAMLARLAAPAAGAAVADPFCGDGTIAVEAALACPGIQMLASDIDPARLGSARRNAARAGVGLPLCWADAAQLPWAGHSVAAVITNPPWNIAVEALGLLRGSLGGFWRQVPSLLTADGRLCLITDARLDAPRQLKRLGYQFALLTQVRLAGRVSHVLLCAPPEHSAPVLPDRLAGWRRRALAGGVVTDAGF
jgi:tRNA (guanine6-N2)-methyltransferase